MLSETSAGGTSSSVASWSVASIIRRKKQHPEGTVAEKLISPPIHIANSLCTCGAHVKSCHVDT